MHNSLLAAENSKEYLNALELKKLGQYSKALKVLKGISSKKEAFKINIVELNVELMLLLEKKNQALNFLTNQIRQHPNELNLLVVRGKTLLKLNYQLSAKDDFQKALKKGLKNSKLFSIMGDLEKQNHNYKNSLKLYKQALKLDSKNDVIWYSKAHTEYLLDANTQAINSIKKALKINPHNFKYRKLHAQILYSSDTNVHTEEVLILINKDFPEEQWGYKELANYYLRKNHQKKAIQVLLNAIQFFPEQGSFYFQLAIGLNAIGKIERALEYFQQGLLFDDDSWVHVQMARIYGKIKNMEQAIFHLNYARKTGTNNPLVYHILTQFYFEKGSNLKAEQVILEGLEIDDNDNTLLAIYGNILEKRGQINNAEYAYRKILSNRPDNFGIMTKLANVLKKKGLHEESDTLFRKAILLNGTSYWVRSLFVDSLMTRRLWREAKQELQEMLNLNYDDYRVYTQKALIERKLGNLIQAVADINKAIILNKNSIGLKELESQILEDMGKYSLAESSLKEALLIAPTNIVLLFQLSFLQKIQNKKSEAINTIVKILENGEPNIASIELLNSLNKQHSNNWKFTPEEEKVYNLILTKKLSDVKKALNSLKSDSLNIYLLRYLKEAVTNPGALRFQYHGIKTFKEIYKSNQASPWQLLILAFQLNDLHEYELAIQYLLAAEKKAPNNVWIQVRLAHALEKKERHSESIQHYNNFLQSWPNSHWANLRLALNYDLNSQPMKAELIYQKLLTMNPKDQIALNNLAWLYLTTNNLDLKNIDKALNLSLQAVGVYSSASNLDTLAEAYYQRKEYQKAIETIEKALNQDTNNLDHFKKQKKKFDKALSKAKIQ